MLPSMDANAARQTLLALREARKETRLRLAAFWFPLEAFGGIMLLAAMMGVLGGRPFLEWSLLAGSVVGSFIVTAFYRRRALDVGLGRAHWPYLLTAALMIAACVLASAAVTLRPAEAGPWLAVAAGYLVFATLERNWALAGLAGAMSGMAFAFVAFAPAAEVGLLTGAQGVTLLFAGTMLHRRAA